MASPLSAKNISFYNCYYLKNVQLTIIKYRCSIICILLPYIIIFISFLPVRPPTSVTSFSPSLCYTLLSVFNSLSGSARHLYVVCIYGAICLQIQNYFPLDPAVFSPKNVILILFYVVSRFMKKNWRFRGKIVRYDALKIKFVDISHRRYKLRRDIE
jgi:hypothetical protein